MASNGLEQRAKTGRCRICQRRRCTFKHVKEVGEVRRGFATGHIWECRDAEECEKVARQRLNDKSRSGPEKSAIKVALQRGRFKHWKIFT